MTIQTDAHKLLADLYRLDENEVSGFQLAATEYQAKLAACTTIARASKTRERWAVKACNGIDRYDAKARMVLASWTDADEAAKDRSDDGTADLIRGALSRLYGPDWMHHIALELQGDPRGAMVKLFSRAEYRDGHGTARIYA